MRAGSRGGDHGTSHAELTAPAAGLWVVQTTLADPAADTVMYARRLCNFPDSELACNDDDDGVGFNSALQLQLDEGETVYVFVDGFVGLFGPWQGPYTLTAAPGF